MLLSPSDDMLLYVLGRHSKQHQPTADPCICPLGGGIGGGLSVLRGCCAPEQTLNVSALLSSSRWPHMPAVSHCA